MPAVAWRSNSRQQRAHTAIKIKKNREGKRTNTNAVDSAGQGGAGQSAAGGESKAPRGRAVPCSAA